jgi:L-methionine (R)-S-oxide reductase
MIEVILIRFIGFYLDSCLFPPGSTQPTTTHDPSRILSLGPFCGKPACQRILTKKGGGVCADAYLAKETLVVPNVDAYPGHIACDGDTKSEIVIPMKMGRINALTYETEEVILGVMDLDSILHDAFDADDVEGLERIVKTLVISCKW